MMINSRIAAFSLAEMLIVMLLSSLASGIIYFAYYTVSRYHVNLTRKYENVSEVNTFNHLVNRDFDRCEYIRLTSQGFACVSRDSTMNVAYDLLPDRIVRNQSSRFDTFQIKPLLTKFWFNRKPVTANAVDVFYLEAVCLSDTLAMKFLKTYDASSLIYHLKKDTIW